MKRAMELAENGRGNVSPNPLVGCVIVCDDKVIGEGWHRQYGGPHAEVNAVNAVKDKKILPESTVYVNLEPCSHFGKTPPCADLLVKHKVKRVVVSTLDPNPQVAGRGMAKLKQNGIEVITGVLEKEGEALNRRFFGFHRNKRPYVMLKWAQTADGYIARENYDSKWISNEYSRQLVHRWRGEEDAILVGKNTALLDDPQLNTRDSEGKNPLRLVLDPRLELPKTLKIFDGTLPTICYNAKENESFPNLDFIKLNGGDAIEEMLKDLFQRDIQSVMVEGGSKLLQSFIDRGYWDEARVFKAPVSFGSGITAPQLKNGVLNSVQEMMGDKLEIYYKK